MYYKQPVPVRQHQEPATGNYLLPFALCLLPYMVYSDAAADCAVGIPGSL